MKRFPEHLIRNAVALALFASGAAIAALQIDLRSGHIAGISDSTQNALGVSGTLYGSFNLGRDLAIAIENRLNSTTGLGGEDSYDDDVPDAVTAASEKLPVAEQNVPSDNTASIALAWRGLQLGYRNQFFGKNRSLDLSYQEKYFGNTDPDFTYGFSYKKKMRHQYKGRYLFENERFIADAALYHFVTDGAIDSMLDFTTYTNSSPVSSSWTRTHLTAGILIPEIQMKLLWGARILTDYTGPQEFDSYDYFQTVDGTLSLGSNTTHYRLTNEYYMQAYLNDSTSPAYALTGMYQTLYLRDNLSITRGLMLKGLAVLSFNEFLLKQRYELSLRQAWLGGSAVEGGFFVTTGGLFPMTGCFVRGVLNLNDRYYITIRLKPVWDLPREDASEFAEHARTLFVKADIGGEVAWRLGSVTELYLGGDYTQFNNRIYPEFPARFFTGAGIRLILQ